MNHTCIGVLITAFRDSDDNQWLSFLKWLLIRRVPTSYRYGKGIVQLKVLLILINIHLLTAQFPNIEPIISNSIYDDLSCGSGESLVDITLSISRMLLLYFIILVLTGDHVTTHSIHHTENFFFFTFELIFIFYYIKFFND